MIGKWLLITSSRFLKILRSLKEKGQTESIYGDCFVVKTPRNDMYCMGFERVGFSFVLRIWIFCKGKEIGTDSKLYSEV